MIDASLIYSLHCHAIIMFFKGKFFPDLFSACVLFLLDNNCNINVQNSSGATPLHYSVAEGHNDLTKRLLQRGAIVNSLVTTNEVSSTTWCFRKKVSIYYLKKP